MSVTINCGPAKAAAKTVPSTTASQDAIKTNVETGENADTGSDADDLLAQAVMEVETLTDASSALMLADKLLLDHGVNYFRLGGVLSAIQENGWHGEYANFGELCEARFGFRKSKAYALIQVYKTLTVCGVTWDDVKGAGGWSKVAALCTKKAAAALGVETPTDYVTDKEASEKFSNLLEMAKSLPLEKLKQEILKVSASGSGDECQFETPVSFTIKPYPDQMQEIDEAIAAVKQQTGTDSNAVAISWICADFLAGASPTIEHRIAAMKNTMAMVGPETSLKCLLSVFPATTVQAKEG